MNEKLEHPLAESNRSLHAENVMYWPIYEGGVESRPQDSNLHRAHYK